jgi:hypothetical protein
MQTLRRQIGRWVWIAAIWWIPGRNVPAELTFKAVLVNAPLVTAEHLSEWRGAGYNSIVLEIGAADVQASPLESLAARQILQERFDLYYWMEIGRCPVLADANPTWMGSLQGHPEWRRHFPDIREPGDNEVVKNYPWVPILYEEAFAAHLKRVQSILANKPQPKGLFLNDLQGVPSACGCGNTLCRWTADYGDKLTAKPLGETAPADFVAAVGRLAPGVEIIPVWVTECEQADMDNFCCGVGCFEGTCWRVYTKQLMPVAKQCPRLGVLAPYRAFGRDLPRYERTAGWVQHAMGTFQSMPPRRDGTAIDANRLIPILQGWDVTPDDVRTQVERVSESAAQGYVVSLIEIDQSWTPRTIPWKK